MKPFKDVNQLKMAGNARRSSLEPRELLVRRALLATRAVVDQVRAMYRDVEQLTGAPIAVHRALACIGGEPGITASKLAEALGVQRPAVSHVLKALAVHGWAERVRSDDDQRSVRIFITAKGRHLLEATSNRAVGALQRAVSQLKDKELSGLAAGLESLLTHLPNRAPNTSRATGRRKSI